MLAQQNDRAQAKQHQVQRFDETGDAASDSHGNQVTGQTDFDGTDGVVNVVEDSGYDRQECEYRGVRPVESNVANRQRLTFTPGGRPQPISISSFPNGMIDGNPEGAVRECGERPPG